MANSPIFGAPNFKTFVMKKIIALMAVLYSISSHAQVSITNPPYQENFDNIASGLPDGFFVQTGSTTTAAGTNATFTPTPTSWNNTNAGFYNCASATGLKPTSNPNEQALSTNRALCVRQTASFGNPGAAYVFKIANTTNKTGFSLTYKLQTLDSTKQGISAWSVDYGIGANPTSFTNAIVTPATYSTGGKPGTPFFVFNRNMSASFGAGLDNKSEPVWIRVWTGINTADPSYNTAYSLLGFNNSTPTMSGIDDWNLSWTNSPNTNVNNLTKANENTFVSGFSGNDLRVDFKQAATSKTIIRLIDINGAVLWEKEYARISANQTEWIRPGYLNKGVYILQIQNADTRITKRIAN